MKLLTWLKSIFVEAPCQHDWQIIGEHKNHPGFEHKGLVIFYRCIGKCDSRRIELA